MNPISILRDTWYFFSRHIGTLLPLCLPWIVLETLTQQQLSMAANSQQFAPWGMAAGLIFYPIYTASLLLYLVDFGEGRQRGAGGPPAALRHGDGRHGSYAVFLGWTIIWPDISMCSAWQNHWQ